jgi:hypothetical protein
MGLVTRDNTTDLPTCSLAPELPDPCGTLPATVKGMETGGGAEQRWSLIPGVTPAVISTVPSLQLGNAGVLGEHS